MAWQPSTNFEEDLVDLQPNHHFMFGQLAYEELQRRTFAPRPQAHYDYLRERLERREKSKDLLAEPENGRKAKDVSKSLTVMEALQQMAGTRPLGQAPTMSDWEDKSTIEQEIVGMMRHFGFQPMTGGKLKAADEPEEKGNGKGVHTVVCGSRKFPLIRDPKYFEPRKPGKAYTPSAEDGKACAVLDQLRKTIKPKPTATQKYGKYRAASKDTGQEDSAFDTSIASSRSSTTYFSAASHLDSSKCTASSFSYDED